MTEPDSLRDTRASYDAVATGYTERFGNELDARPLDRGMRAGFAERVRAAGAEPDDDGDFPEREQQAFLLARKPAQRGER